MATIHYDYMGRPMEQRELKKPETRQIASATVRDRWSTYPSSGLTPSKLANILKAADNGDVSRQAELFEEMEEKDAHLFSQLQTRKLAVQGLGWDISPASDDAKAKKVADFCRDWLEDFEGFDDAVLDLLDALGKGYSAMEITWDVSSGQAVIVGLEHIHAKKVTFWNSVEPRLLTDANPVQGEEPPPFKVAYHRYKARSGYDTRAGILRVCVWMYLFKNYDIKDWISFAEVYGQPLRLGKYAPGATQDEKDALLDAVRSIGSDAAGIISRNTEIDFVEGQKYGSVSLYEKLAKWCDEQMSKAVLGQVLTSSTGDVGSQALGSVHNDVRQDLTEADCKALARTVRGQLLLPMVGYNFGWDAARELLPGFRFLFEPPEDIKAVADTYDVLVGMGFPMSQEHISDRFKVPMMAKGETPLLQLGTTSKEAEQKFQRLKWELAAGRSDPDGLEIDCTSRFGNMSCFPYTGEQVMRMMKAQQEQDPRDMITARLMTMPSTEELVDAVKAELKAATSLEDFRDRILGVYGALPGDSFRTVLKQALALAELAGRFDASAQR